MACPCSTRTRTCCSRSTTSCSIASTTACTARSTPFRGGGHCTTCTTCAPTPGTRGCTAAIFPGISGLGHPLRNGAIRSTTAVHRRHRPGGGRRQRAGTAGPAVGGAQAFSRSDRATRGLAAGRRFVRVRLPTRRRRAARKPGRSNAHPWRGAPCTMIPSQRQAHACACHARNSPPKSPVPRAQRLHPAHCGSRRCTGE